MKRLTKLLLLFLPLHTQAAYLCTATSDHYPAFTDGIVFSKEVELEGPQGMPNGHIDLHHQSGFDFRLVAGRTMVQNGNKQLIDFYTEIHHDASGLVVRSKSGSNDGLLQARTEMVRYPEKSQVYSGIVIFDCKQY